MCEDNAVEILMTFNFAGIADELEDALSFKARNVDPRARPCYSKILYTWYIRRGDYRNGMYFRPTREFPRLKFPYSGSDHVPASQETTGLEHQCVASRVAG